MAKIRGVHFPWQCLWIVIIMYVCHFSSFSTKQNEQWEFCWESKDNYKREERGKKKHFAWMRERITTWRSGCYGRQNVERRTSSTFKISSITFSSSLSIFFFRLWPQEGELNKGYIIQQGQGVKLWCCVCFGNNHFFF